MGCLEERRGGVENALTHFSQLDIQSQGDFMTKLIFKAAFLPALVALVFEAKALACGSQRMQVEEPGLQERLIQSHEDAKLPKKRPIYSRYPGSRLNPPWWIIRSELVYSIGAAPGVVIGEPEVTLSQGRVRVSDLQPGVLDGLKNSEISIGVYADTLLRAQALAFVLKSTVESKSATVKVWVNDPAHPGSPLTPPAPVPSIDLVSYVQQNIEQALTGNPYFVGFSERMNSPLMPKFFVMFSREEIQFFADNIGDAYRNINAVAEDIFFDVMNMQYFDGVVRVGVSTVLKEDQVRPSAPPFDDVSF